MTTKISSFPFSRPDPSLSQARFFDLLEQIYELNGRFDEIDEKRRPFPKEDPWSLEAARAEVRKEGKLKDGSPEFEKEAWQRVFELMKQKKMK